MSSSQRHEQQNPKNLFFQNLFSQKLFFRDLIKVVAVGLLLTSCQSGSGASSAPEPAEPAVEATALTRTIEHAMGTSQVPITPERIVVLDTAPLDAAVALGITPVGSIAYGSLPTYLEMDREAITVIGEGNTPNLETILRLRPDLILGSKPGTEKIYQQLAQIAPTVLAEDSGRSGDWPEHFRLYAETLGKSEQAEQLLQNYQTQVAQLQQQIDPSETLEVSVLATSEDRIAAYTAGSFAGSVLQDIGLARNPAQAGTRRYAIQLSREGLDKLDGDHLFLVYSAHFQGIPKEAFVSDSIWSQLEAVRQDKVCEVPNEVWIAGRSILAAKQILTDVEACLTSAD
ncbi:MAG: iron-siderophore ABC transporter substrate-binding protein [Cyanobacteria bacterium J06626_6]